MGNIKTYAEFLHALKVSKLIEDAMILKNDRSDNKYKSLSMKYNDDTGDYDVVLIPVKGLERIDVSFKVLPTGTDFDDFK